MDVVGENQRTDLYRDRTIPVSSVDLATFNDDEFDRITYNLALHKDSSHIFLTRDNSNVILILNKDGELISKLTSKVDMPNPCGIFLSVDRIYVTQNPGHFVMVLNMEGDLLAQFGRRGSKACEFIHPYNITGDQVTGCIFICDMHNSRIQIFTHDCEFVTMFGEDILQSPIDIAYHDEQLFVLENNSSRGRGSLYAFNSHYPFVSQISDKFNYCSRLSDQYGNVLIAGYCHHTIFVLNREGDIIKEIGNDLDNFNTPSSVLVYNENTFFVACDFPTSKLYIFWYGQLSYSNLSKL